MTVIVNRQMLPQAAQTYAAAFADDPVHCWLFPDANIRHQCSPAFYQRLMSPDVARGLLTADQQIHAVANWEPPAGSPNELQLGMFETAGLYLGMAAIMRSALLRGLAIKRIQANARPKSPHWYLALIATHPEHQGRGLAAQLIEPVLAHCDAESLPAYLESSNPDNISYYRKFGFEQTGELPMPGGGPALYPMLRNPGKT